MSYRRRQIEILINGDTFIAPSDSARQFRIVFDITIDFGGAVSYCDARFYNLSTTTASKAFERGKTLTLRAGYSDTIDALFAGKIRNVFKERDGASTVTRIVAVGGSQPLNTINKTEGVNATVPQIIKSCADAMGYPLVIDDTQFSADPVYIRGYALQGDPRQYINDLSKTHAFNWIIENETIVIVKDGLNRRELAPHVVSERTGMEGIPEITETGVEVNVRLNPKIRIGGQVDIQSKLRTFNFSNVYYQNIPQGAGVGIYNVYKLQHSGDTWGDDWTTSVIGYRENVTLSN